MSLKSRPDYQVVLEVSFTSLLAIASMALNMLSCVIVWKNPLLRTWHNLFTLNLMVIDLVCTLLSTTFTILVLGYGKWILGHSMCYLSGYINAVLANVIISTLALFSFSRYQLFVSPRNYLVTWNKKKCLTSIVIAWIIALAISSPPLFGWGKYSFLEKNAVCFLNFNANQTFSSIYVYVFLAIPLIFAVVYLLRLYIALRNHRRHKSEADTNSIHFRQTLSAATSMLILALAFFFCWIPTFVIFALDAVHVYLSRGVCLLATLMCYIFGLILPLIYAATSSVFKIGFRVHFRVKKMSRCSVEPAKWSAGNQSAVSQHDVSSMNKSFRTVDATVHREDSTNEHCGMPRPISLKTKYINE